VPDFEDLKEALKPAAAILRGTEVPFLLGGGLACWARGGPESEHDLDFMVKPEDADQALQAFAKAGLETERPPENWLYKAWLDGVLVDLIFNPKGGPVDDAMFARAEELEVNALPMLVLSLEDVMTTKLMAMREHEVDYDSVIEIARSLREQIDWEAVWERTCESPYARAFFYLASELDILGMPTAAGGTAHAST
jgi:hypothetical protein